MKQSLLAHRYARAFVQASLRKGEMDQRAADLKDFSELLSQIPLLMTALSNPGIPAAKKGAILEKIVKAPLLKHLIRHLIRRNQLSLVREIASRAQHLMDEEKGISRAVVKTATSLSQEETERLAESLKDFFQRPVLIEETVVPDLLAGMTVRVGDTIMDNSLKGQLERLEKHLKTPSPL